MDPAARHLCLHYVAAGAAAGPTRRLALSPEVLRACLVRELERGAAASLADCLTGPLGPDRFTVSFDDAHVSVLEGAAPVLAELGIPGTLFVPTAWIGMGPEWLDEDGLRRLRDHGWTIGAHSVSHPRMGWALHGEDPAAHARRLEDECATSRDTLARLLGAPPALFAYPYGEDPPLARQAARAAGFALAFTVRESSAWDGDPLSIPRLDGMEATGVVQAGQGPPLGISVVVPARDRSAILAHTLGRLAAQSYPPERHEVIRTSPAAQPLSVSPHPAARASPASPRRRLRRRASPAVVRSGASEYPLRLRSRPRPAVAGRADQASRSSGEPGRDLELRRPWVSPNSPSL